MTGVQIGRPRWPRLVNAREMKEGVVGCNTQSHDPGSGRLQLLVCTLSQHFSFIMNEAAFKMSDALKKGRLYKSQIS